MGGSTSGVVSDSFPQSSLAPRSQSSEQLLSAHARSLCHSVRRLRDELEETRREHKDRMADLQVELILTKNLISAAVTGIMNSAQICSGESFCLWTYPISVCTWKYISFVCELVILSLLPFIPFPHVFLTTFLIIPSSLILSFSCFHPFPFPSSFALSLPSASMPRSCV